MAEPLKLIKPTEDQPPPGLVMTQVAVDILRSVQLVWQEPGTLTMVAGLPGCGKSATLEHYAAGNKDALKLDIVAGEGGISYLATAIMQLFGMGLPNSRRMLEERKAITSALGYGRVLIIDEAQYLAVYNPRGGFNFDALEWLRAMAEEGGFSVVFCGDLSLVDIIDKVPQLKRRMVRPVVIRAMQKEDVAAFATSRGVTDPAIFDVLAAMARRYGGLADVKRTLERAEQLSGSGRIGASEVKAAMLYLGLTGQGGV